MAKFTISSASFYHNDDSKFQKHIFCKKFDLKNNEKYYYYHELTKSWSCTQQLIDFITNLFLEDPLILERIKQELKEQK